MLESLAHTQSGTKHEERPDFGILRISLLLLAAPFNDRRLLEQNYSGTLFSP
jgi:hypothetical protein